MENSEEIYCQTESDQTIESVERDSSLGVRILNSMCFVDEDT